MKKVFPSIGTPKDHGIRPEPDPRFEGVKPRRTGRTNDFGISAEIGRMWQSGIGGKVQLVSMVLTIVLLLLFLSIFFPTFDPGR